MEFDFFYEELKKKYFVNDDTLPPKLKGAIVKAAYKRLFSEGRYKLNKHKYVAGVEYTFPKKLHRKRRAAEKAHNYDPIL